MKHNILMSLNSQYRLVSLMLLFERIGPRPNLRSDEINETINAETLSYL